MKNIKVKKVRSGGFGGSVWSGEMVMLGGFWVGLVSQWVMDKWSVV